MTDLITMEEAMQGARKAKRGLRVRLGEMQGWRCAYCATPFSSRGARRITLDHFIPRSRGGKFSYLNCVAACYSCNHQRASIDALLFYEALHSERAWKRGGIPKKVRAELHAQTGLVPPPPAPAWHSKNAPIKRLYYIEDGTMRTWEELNPNLRDNRPL